jgi:hypothetical protein
VLAGRVATVVLFVAPPALVFALDTAKDSFNVILQVGAGTGLLYLLRWFWWRVTAWCEIVAMASSFGMKIAAIAVVCLVGSGVLVYLYRDAKRDVAEFACDKNSFRFRKLGTARSETRALAEVATVGERRDKSGLPIGCRVVFQDGTEAFLEYAMLPNARALSDRLRSHVPGDWRR